MTDTVTRPCPHLERIAELERKLAASFDAMARERNPDIAELRDLLERTRQQYVDTDHMLRLRDDECRRLRSEVGTLRFEAKDLMAAEVNHVQAIDAYKVRVAHLEHEQERLVAENAWLKDNAKRQADVIRDLDRGTRLPWRVHGNLGDATTIQTDPPPTRAEESWASAQAASLRAEERDAMASLANTLAGIDNEERD